MFKLNMQHLKKNQSSINIKKEENKNSGNENQRKGFFEIFRKKDTETGSIEYYRKQVLKKEKKRATVQERRHKLRDYIEKAGLGINPDFLSKIIFNLCIGINLLLSAFLIYHFSTTFGITWQTILAWIFSLWVLVFIILLFVLWAFFYFFVDLRVFKRNLDLEDVLPDYLQLTSSNIKAGMTVDRALWYAVRPRFGVLAKEIEIVAKDTMKGEDLKAALQKFANKYDSMLLKRSVSLLIEGLEAGGEIGELLNKIASNIQENKLMRKEMAANITTYVIFITFATVAAAPLLFALAGTLIKVISSLGSTVGKVANAAASSGLGFSFAGTSINYADFRIFAVVSLVITSFFSATIIAIIKKGDAKSGFKYIPIFILITLTLFFIGDFFFNQLIGVFFK